MEWVVVSQFCVIAAVVSLWIYEIYTRRKLSEAVSHIVKALQAQQELNKIVVANMPVKKEKK